MMETRYPMRILQRGHGLWRRFRAGMTLGVRVILECDQGIVLVRHTYLPGWHFPGGGVDAGETVFEAAVREVREETGIEVGTLPRLVGFFHNARPRSRDHVALFHCGDFTVPDVWPGRSLEIAECRLFLPDALPLDLSSGTRRRLAEFHDGEPVAARW